MLKIFYRRSFQTSYFYNFVIFLVRSSLADSTTMGVAMAAARAVGVSGWEHIELDPSKPKKNRDTFLPTTTEPGMLSLY